MRTLLGLSTLLLVVGCGGYKRDVETVCNVRARVKIPPGTDAAQIEERIKAYLFVEIHSPKAKKVFLSLATMTDEAKLALLRKEAAAEGLASCPLADEVEAALAAQKAKAAAAPPPPAPPPPAAAAPAEPPAPAAAPAQ